MGAAWPIQVAIFNVLNGSAALAAQVKGVYDGVPELNDNAPDPDADFPYVTIGEDDIDAWDTDTEVGYSAFVTVHTWSRYLGQKETKTIQDIVDDELNRRQLTVSGHIFVDCLHVESRAFLDPDGKTRHGVSTFRVTVQQ